MQGTQQIDKVTKSNTIYNMHLRINDGVDGDNPLASMFVKIRMLLYSSVYQLYFVVLNHK